MLLVRALRAKPRDSLAVAVRHLSTSPVDWETVWAHEHPSFHMDTVSVGLEAFLDGGFLDEAQAKVGNEHLRAFVPLCGKSVDVPYLASRGMHVIGLEFSRRACRRAADAWQLAPTPAHLSDGVSLVGSKFAPDIPTANSSRKDGKRGSMALLCGDIVALPPAQLDRSHLIWDRAGVTSVTAQSLGHGLRSLSVGDIELLPPSRLERLRKLATDTRVEETVAAYYAILGEVSYDGAALLAETLATQSPSGSVAAGVGAEALAAGLREAGWRDVEVLAEDDVTAEYPAAQIPSGHKLVEVRVTGRWATEQ